MKFLLALTMSLTMASFLIAGGVPTRVTYVRHDKVSATMMKGGPIIEDEGLRVLANRREAGQAEMHGKTNHIFIIVEGEATMVVGGGLVKPQTRRANQWRGSGIQGGQIYHLTKGDVITIPANTPHWWKEISTGTVAYYAVNIQSE